MKMNLIAPLLLVFSVLLPTPSQSSTESELHILIEELSAISRITNALAFQSYTAQNKLNVSQVLAELLKTSNASLMELRKLHSSEMATSLAWIAEQTNFLTSQSSEVEKNKTMELVQNQNTLNRLMPLGSFIKENMSVPKVITEFGPDLSKLFTSGVVVFCSGEQALETLSQIINNSFPTSKKLNDGYQKFDESALKVLSCFEKVDDAFEDHLKLYKKVEEQGRFFYHQKVIAKFFIESFESLVALPDTFAKMSQKLKSHEQFWSSKNSRKFNNSLQALEAARNAFSATRVFNASVFPLTAGFRSLDDLAKVTEDLKSEMFLREVIKNNAKDAESLRKSLAPFERCSEPAKTLNALWGAITESYQELEGDFILQITNSIKYVAQFSNGANLINFDVSKVLDKKQEILAKCWENNTIHNSTELLLIAYDDQNNTLSLLWDNFNSVMTVIEPFLPAMDKFQRELDGARKKTAELKIFKEFIDEVSKKFNETSASKRQEVFDTFRSSEKYEVFKRVVERAENLRRLQTAIQDKRPSIFTGDVLKLNLELFWKLTMGKEIMACMLQLNSSQNEWVPIFNFVQSLQEFPSGPHLNETVGIFGKLAAVFDNINALERSMKSWTKRDPLISLFVNPMEISQRFAKGINTIHSLEEVTHKESFLMNATSSPRKTELENELKSSHFGRSDEITALIDVWLKKDAKKKVDEMLNQLDALNPIAKKVRKDLSQLKFLFEKATKIKGVPVSSETFRTAARILRHKFQTESKMLEKVAELDLNFASRESELMGASTSLNNLLAAYTVMYSRSRTTSGQEKESIVAQPASYFLIIILSVIGGVLFTSIIIFILVKTKRGRRIYKKWYLYYFGKEEDFEKLWRYSYFLDTVNGENILDATVCLANSKKLKEVLRKGAYVDAYNIYGNTALHTCVKSIHALANDEFVEMAKILITHGADRNLLNFENRTAEQLIAWKAPLVSKRSVEMSDVFSKYREKQFRLHVPMEFDSSFFQIYCGHHLDHQSAEKFIEKFKSLASDEVVPATTHVVVVVNKEGFLETDDFVMLSWIFLGYIIVKEKWIEDCIKDKDLLDDDEKYLVEGVKYNGVEYPNVVLPWTESFAKSMMPYLLGVQIVLFYTQCPFYARLKSVVSKLGGTVLQEVPETFNQNARPYLHANRNAVWIVHDGTCDVTAYENDRQGRFSVLTEQEFVVLLLQRKIVRDTTVYPIYAAEPKSNT